MKKGSVVFFAVGAGVGVTTGYALQKYIDGQFSIPGLPSPWNKPSMIVPAVLGIGSLAGGLMTHNASTRAVLLGIGAGGLGWTLWQYLNPSGTAGLRLMNRMNYMNRPPVMRPSGSVTANPGNGYGLGGVSGKVRGKTGRVVTGRSPGFQGITTFENNQALIS